MKFRAKCNLNNLFVKKKKKNKLIKKYSNGSSNQCLLVEKSFSIKILHTKTMSLQNIVSHKIRVA